MATIRDVAKLAGVSAATVSRVINQKGYVNKETEDKIKKSMEQLHYIPNTLARGLASKKTDTIALIIPNVSNPFFPELVRSVEDAAKEFGLTLLLGNSYNNEAKAIQYVNIFKNKFVDGVIIFAAHQFYREDLAELEALELPTVIIDKALEADDAYSGKSNNYEGAQLAVRHLLSLGRRRIAHISGPQKLYPARERLRGYTEVMKEHGLYDEALVVQGDFTINGGLEAARRLLLARTGADAIFAGNDLTAVGCMKALLRQGVRIPEDIALIGYDGIPLLTMVEPEISTIELPIYNIGQAAVTHLIDRIHEAPIASPHVTNIMDQFEIQLKVRASTRKEG